MIDDAEIKELVEKIAADEKYRRKITITKLVMALVLQLAAYSILAYVDWRIALGVFFVQWAIQLTIPKKIK